MKRLIIIPLMFIWVLNFACTSAIITGKATIDGRPLMWKHRDSGELNNRIEFIKGNKYSFISLTNSPDVSYPQSWAGTNETGFSIMNTASYNLKNITDTTQLSDLEGIIIFNALSSCETLQDFEIMLSKSEKPLGVEANFGVIDAKGGAAYYEVNNYGWKKLDVNDSVIAPEGFLIETNFSYTGRNDQGMGYIRYNTARNLFSEHISKGNKLSAQWIFSNCSRSFNNSLLGIDLIKDKSLTPNGFFIDQDFIPRRSSSASIVFQGVLPDENPIFTTMWTVLGYPPISTALPLFVNNPLPQYIVKYADTNYDNKLIKVNDNNNCELCDFVLSIKEDIFPIKRGNGKSYFNFALLFNEDNSGYTQIINNLDEQTFNKFNCLSLSWRQNSTINSDQLNNLYSQIYDSLYLLFPKQ